MSTTPGSGLRKCVPDLIPGAVFVDTQYATLTSLQSNRARGDPDFAEAIIRAYAKAKIMNGKSVEEVDEKLDALHKQVFRNELGPFDEEIQEVNAFIRTKDALAPSFSGPYVDEEEAARAKGYWKTGSLGQWNENSAT